MDRPTISNSESALIDLTRRKTPAELTRLASQMFNNARDRLHAYLRQRHPEWTSEQLRAELLRRIHGSK